MYLFAEASESNGFGFLILLFILVMGTRQWCIWLKGNDALRGAAKKVNVEADRCLGEAQGITVRNLCLDQCPHCCC